ncbi:MAG: hypothetical protein KGI05_09505, partial [Thaumarchaeota archaeon]|nr:hypothetical protein [Nitrososphaerota archaeon]
MEQFKSGIRAQDVKCGEDLVLMIKAENGFPACVMPQTAQKLVERGWGILANHESQQTSVMPSIHPSSMSCQISYPQTGTGTAVLFMPLNTTGKICVQYSNSNRPQPAGIKIFNAQDMSKDAQNISVTMDHDLIPIGNSTIMYTITTDNHATFY